MNMIILEVDRAESKFPQWPKDIIHAASIVGEESGELQKATLEYVYENKQEHACLEEAIHTAATAMRFIDHYLDKHYSTKTEY